MFRAFFVRHAPSAVTQPTSEMSARVLGRVLFSLLGVHPPPGIGLSGDRGLASVKHHPSCGVRNALVGP
uniref:Hypotheticial protein n=2 Tax=Schistosoma TaxID=6181 RepID=C1LD60_SCHJA|nr:hypotheticial protein [Schistosoma japonicum]